jgi:hypothetical protein
VATVLERSDSAFDPATTMHLRASMLETYFRLRIGMSAAAFVFPVIFYVYWLRVGPGPEHLNLDSISAFYGTGGLARDLFVAILWVIASFLIGYKGLTVVEDWLLNSAGLCAAMIAVIPCTCWHDGDTQNVWHTRFAVSFFVLMSLVVFFFGHKTLNLLSKPWKAFFSWAYYVNSASLVGSVGLVIVLKEWLPDYTGYVFRAEWLGIWSFGAYWALKTWEYSKTDFEGRVARGEVQYHRKAGFVPTAP